MRITEKPGQVYSIATDNRPLSNATIINMTFDVNGYTITHYSLGANTYIEAERYSHPALYICVTGHTHIVYRENDERKEAVLEPGGVFVRPAYVLCSFFSDEDSVYTEIGVPLDAKIHQTLKERSVFHLKNLLQYSQDGPARMNLIEGGCLELYLLAYEKGQTSADSHNNGETLVTVLEGALGIIYNNSEEILLEGESFLLEEGVPHSFVTFERCRLACVAVFDTDASV